MKRDVSGRQCGAARSEKRPMRTLIIGYGNIDRADDGVAYHVINALRRQRGMDILDGETTGLEALGAEPDSIVLSQLTPELMELLCDYERIVFVDAHVCEGIGDLHCSAVTPEYTPASLTHHLTPGMLLAMVKAVYQREPAGRLVSIRGYDFGFRRELSDRTRALVGQAVDHLLQWLDGNSSAT
jgi:hydrogenase maturation protease